MNNSWKVQSQGSYGKTDKFGQINGCTANPQYPTDPMQRPNMTDEDITSVFLRIDRNHNGKISVAEMMLFMARQNVKLDHKKTFAMLDKFDCRNDDDQLDLLEFIDFFRAMFPERVSPQ